CKAARTSPPQLAMASSTSASSRAAVSASDFCERSDAFTSGLPCALHENKKRTQSQGRGSEEKASSSPPRIIALCVLKSSFKARGIHRRRYPAFWVYGPRDRVQRLRSARFFRNA